MWLVKTLCWQLPLDIVADPSAPDAFVSGIMEGKEWVWDGGILREQQAEKPINRSTLWSPKNNLMRRNLTCSMTFSTTFSIKVLNDNFSK